MVPKSFHNFNSCDVTKNLDAGKLSNSLFLGRYFQEKKILGELGFPKKKLQKRFPLLKPTEFVPQVEVMQKDH